MEAHWENMVNAIVGEAGIGDAVCEAIVAECTGQEMATRAWNCDTCKARVEQFDDLSDNIALSTELGLFLSGPAYCGAYEDMVTANICKGFVIPFTTVAWRVAFDDFAAQPEYFCKNAYSLCETGSGGNGSMGVSPTSAMMLAVVAAAAKVFA